jgi:ABC-type cobalamin/Fe3+-siderophores transport system ATPase subunit
MAQLEIRNLHVATEDGTEIVRGVDLGVSPDEVHAIMGPNGSGKSTLAYALMGHPAYEITEGEILLDGENIAGVLQEESGKVRIDAALEMPGLADAINFYGENSARFLAEERVGAHIGFRQHGYGDCGSVYATAGFGLRHALHAMHAALVLELAVDPTAFD